MNETERNGTKRNGTKRNEKQGKIKWMAGEMKDNQQKTPMIGAECIEFNRNIHKKCK